MSQKRSLNDLNQHKSNIIDGDEPALKKQKQSIESKLFVNNDDHQQFVNIFKQIEKTRIFKSTEKIIKIISEFSTGIFEQCANEHCSQDISILHETKNSHNAIEVSFYKRLGWEPHQLLCSDCISFMLSLKKVRQNYKTTLHTLGSKGIFSVSDLNKYKRKRYILFHQLEMNPRMIDRLYDIEKCTCNPREIVWWDNQSSDCMLHNSDEPIDESQCLDKQFINPNDLAMSIWDVPGFNLGKILEESSNYDKYNILASLKTKIPQIIRRISPKQLDLKNYFSERHGSLLFKLCCTGNLELVKYFIEEYQLNPHFVYPQNLNVMFFVLPHRSRGAPGVLKFLAGLGCSMELISTKGKTCASFIGDDDCATPRYSNTKMLMSFGFNLDDIAEIQHSNSKHSVTIGNRISLGGSYGDDLQRDYGQIELLQPKNVMNENVLQNVRRLAKILIGNMYGSNVIENICNVIFAYLNVRDVCSVYQYTVNKNQWNKIMDSEFLQ